MRYSQIGVAGRSDLEEGEIAARQTVRIAITVIEASLQKDENPVTLRAVRDVGDVICREHQEHPAGVGSDVTIDAIHLWPV